MDNQTPFHFLAQFMTQDWRDRASALLKRHGETILRLAADVRVALEEGGRPNESAWNTWIAGFESELWDIAAEIEVFQQGVLVTASDLDNRLQFSYDKSIKAEQAFRSNDFETFLAIWEDYARRRITVAEELAVLPGRELEPWERKAFNVLFAKLKED